MLTAEMTNAEAMERFVLKQDVLDRAVKNAIDPAVRMVRARAPRKTGALRAGIIRADLLRGGLERSAAPGKAVGQIVMDRDKNDEFVKVTRYGTRYYYPASQEYGFLHTSREGYRRVPGHHFFHAVSRLYAPNMEALAERVTEEILL